MYKSASNIAKDKRKLKLNTNNKHVSTFEEGIIYLIPLSLKIQTNSSSNSAEYTSI